MKHDTEWLKFEIALWFNKHYGDACWFNLCMWAMGAYSFSDTFGKYGNWRNQDCTNINGDYAYCGKCVRTGRLKE